MKARILIFTLIFLAIGLWARSRKANPNSILDTDMLRIELVGTGSSKINIGDTLRTAGDKYRADQIIHWDEDTDYIRVWNMRTKTRQSFCAREFKARRISIPELVKTRTTHTKGAAEQMKVFSGTHYMIEDELRIYTSLQMDDSHGFIVYTIPGNVEIVLPYDESTGEVLLTRGIMEENGIEADKSPVRFHVEYWIGDQAVASINDMLIEYIPKK